MSKRLFLQITYDGSNYAGWQVQPDKPTVMGVMEDCLSRMLQRDVHVHGCGRTDAGVHAQQFFLHFEDEGDIRDDLAFRLNAMVPKDFKIISMHRDLPEDAHARMDAVERTYRYYIHTKANPFLQPYSMFYPWVELDKDKVHKVAAIIPEISNFRGLTRRLLNEDSVHCKVSRSVFTPLRSGIGFYYEIRANRFLTGMVRRIVGLLLLAGKGEIDTEEAIIQLENAEKLPKSVSVPAHGLHLWRIKYPYLDIPPVQTRDGHPACFSVV